MSFWTLNANFDIIEQIFVSVAVSTWNTKLVLLEKLFKCAWMAFFWWLEGEFSWFCLQFLGNSWLLVQKSETRNLLSGSLALMAEFGWISCVSRFHYWVLGCPTLGHSQGYEIGRGRREEFCYKPCSIVFYSIWCHLVALLFWLITAPSLPSSFSIVFFPCFTFPFPIFPDVYFILSRFDSVLVSIKTLILHSLLSLSHPHLNCVSLLPHFISSSNVPLVFTWWIKLTFSTFLWCVCFCVLCLLLSRDLLIVTSLMDKVMRPEEKFLEDEEKKPEV